MWTIFKVFTEFVTILLLFYLLFFFGCEASGILTPDQGLNLHSTLEGKVLTTGLPGKFLFSFYLFKINVFIIILFMFNIYLFGCVRS